MRKRLRALLMDGWEAELQAGEVLSAGGLQAPGCLPPSLSSSSKIGA